MKSVLIALLLCSSSMLLNRKAQEEIKPISISLEAFIDSISLATKIPKQVIKGVGISETGWGKAGVGVPPVNNLFGIRKGDNWGGETYKGWRKYPTKKDAVQDFCNFILKHYPFLIGRNLEKWLLFGYGNSKYEKKGYFKQF